MQNKKLKILLNFLIIFNFAFCAAYPETLEDIREKTGWQPPKHSDQESAYIIQVTPVELIANLYKYHRNKIKMQALFFEITTTDLDQWLYTGGTMHKWSSKRYILFRIKDPKARVPRHKINLFVNKNSSDVDTLLKLSRNTPIMITGTVKDVEYGKAWIDVEKIETVEKAIFQQSHSEESRCPLEWTSGRRGISSDSMK